MICNPEEASRNHLCLPRDYNKFDLPHPGTVNIIDIGIDIVDVLRINDKVSAPGTRQGQDIRSWGFISRSETFIKSLAHKSARTNRNQLKTLLTSPGLDKTLGNIFLLIAAFLLLAAKMENEEYEI